MFSRSVFWCEKDGSDFCLLTRDTVARRECDTDKSFPIHTIMCSCAHAALEPAADGRRQRGAKHGVVRQHFRYLRGFHVTKVRRKWR